MLARAARNFILRVCGVGGWGMEEGNQTSAFGKLLALYFTLVFANIDAAHMSMRLEGYTQKCRQGLWVSLYAS